MSALRYAKTCDVCGGPFVAKRSDARYCSPACRQRGARQGKSQSQRPEATTVEDLMEQARAHLAETMDPAFMTAVKAVAQYEKEIRQIEKEIRDAERWTEKEQARRAKEELKLDEIERDRPFTAIRYFEQFNKSVKAANKVIGAYSKEYKEMAELAPQLSQLWESSLDRELDDMKGLLHRLEKRRHPGGRNPLNFGDIIDAKSYDAAEASAAS